MVAVEEQVEVEEVEVVEEEQVEVVEEHMVAVEEQVVAVAEQVVAVEEVEEVKVAVATLVSGAGQSAAPHEARRRASRSHICGATDTIRRRTTRVRPAQSEARGSIQSTRIRTRSVQSQAGISLPAGVSFRAGAVTSRASSCAECSTLPSGVLPWVIPAPL